MSNENITNLNGDNVRETLEGLLEREANGEINHLTVVAVLKSNEVLTSESWMRKGARPFTMLGGLQYMQACVLSKLAPAE